MQARDYIDAGFCLVAGISLAMAWFSLLTSK
jgi:hypothetical protein